MIRFLVTLTLCFLLTPVYADGIEDDLYTVRIPVGESRELDQQSIQHGLLKVLVKLTGDRDLLFNTELIKEVEQINQSYISRHQILTDLSPLQREINFNESLVQALLVKKGLVVWPTPRPTTLIWLSVRSEKGEYFIASDSNIPAQWKGQLELLTNERGVEFVFPVLGLNELNQITVEDLWSEALPGKQNRLITKFSSIYQTDQVAMLRIEQGPLRWQSAWELFSFNGELLNSGNFFIDSKETSKGINNVFEQMIHDVWLREKTILKINQTFTLEITNIDSSEDYALITNLIKTSRWLKAANLKAVKKNQVVYQINSYGTGIEFLESLNREQNFEWLGREYVYQQLQQRSTDENSIMVSYQLRKQGSALLPDDEL